MRHLQPTICLSPFYLHKFAKSLPRIFLLWDHCSYLGKSQLFGNRFRSLHVIVFPHTRRHQVVKLLLSLSRFAFPAHFNVLYESALHRAIYYCSHLVLFLSRAPRTLLSVGAIKIVIFFCLGFFPSKCSFEVAKVYFLEIW